MKKHLLLLAIASLSTSPVSASKYSWTGVSLKMLAGYSNLRMNYTGDQPVFGNLQTTRYPSFGPSRSGGYQRLKIVEKVSGHGASLDSRLGFSKEISESFGLMGELGGVFGGSPKLINSDDAFMARVDIAGGLFYHQPSFRIYGMGGIGIGRDIFGYPNAVETLQKGGEVTHREFSALINSTAGLTYKASVGVDFKINELMILGLDYTYSRSATTTTLTNNETFYISSHNISAMLGMHM